MSDFFFTSYSPPRDIKDAVSQMVNPATKRPLSLPILRLPILRLSLYIGKRPAVDWDEQIFKVYAALSGVCRVGSWNGNGATSEGGDAPFSCLGTITTDSKIDVLKFLYDDKNKALVGFDLYHSDNTNECYG